MAKKLGIGCGALLGLLVVLGVIGAVIGGEKTTGTPVSESTTQPVQQPSTCSPKPCASTGGFIVLVGNVQRNVPPSAYSKPEAGNHFVLVTVSFKNDSNSEKHANPTEFVLKDSTGIKHSYGAFGATGCDSWSPVNLTKGSTFGPRPICFEAGGNATAPLVLVWTPSLFGRDIEIPLQ